MKRRCVVVGAGGHARAVLGMLRASNLSDQLEAVLVADLAPSGAQEDILGCPVQPLPAELADLKRRGIDSALLAIGNNAARRKHFERFAAAGFELPNLISSRAFVDPSATLGRGNVVAHGAHVGPCARLGDNNIVNTNANVEHECSIGDHCHLAPGSILCGRVVVDDGCMLGAGSVVKEGVRLARDVQLGAGAVLVRHAERAATCLVGVPAREAMGE